MIFIMVDVREYNLRPHPKVRGPLRERPNPPLYPVRSLLAIDRRERGFVEAPPCRMTTKKTWASWPRPNPSKTKAVNKRSSKQDRQDKTVKTRPSRQGRQDEAVIIRGDDLLIGADDEIRTHAGKAQRLTSVDALFHPCIYNPASEQSCQEHSTCLAVTPESKWSLSYRPESYLGTVPLCPEI